MPKVHFYLKKAEEKTGLSLIYLQVKFNGRRLVYSFDEKIKPTGWDPKKERAKDRNTIVNKKNSVQLLNDLLSKLTEEFDLAYRTFRVSDKKGIDAVSSIKNQLEKFLDPESQDKSVGLFDLLDMMIAGTIGDTMTEATKTTYKTAKKHLLAFTKATKYPVGFDTINLDFKDRYKRFLEADRIYTELRGGKSTKVKYKGMKPNSIYKEIKNVRTIMNLALDRDLTKNGNHTKKGFAVEQVETDSIYLTDKELRYFLSIDLSKMRTLEEVRDLFVFSSYVGLRYSDIIHIRPENIVKIDGDPYIKIVAQKTKIPVTIPCNDVVLKILEKYKDTPSGLPRALSNQKFNQYIKDAAKECGLTDKGRLVSDLKKPLFEAISSHTARRSFATNAFISGMQPRLIRIITGHKTEASFEKYLKLSEEQGAKMMNEHNKALSRRSMKIA